MDLSGCFAQGQAYVALSRARSANGLKVWGVGCGVWGVGCGVWEVGSGERVPAATPRPSPVRPNPRARVHTGEATRNAFTSNTCICCMHCAAYGGGGVHMGAGRREVALCVYA